MEAERGLGLWVYLIYERKKREKEERQARNKKDENPWEQWLLPQDHESP